MTSLVPSLDIAVIAGAVAAVIFGALFLLAAAIFIVGIGNRSDPDPRGSRPMAAYYYAAAFLFLWTVFFGVASALDSLIRLVGSNPSPPFGFGVAPDYTNAAIRDCVLAAILLVFAGTAFGLHLQRGNVLADTEEDQSGPTKRVMRSYVALVSFVSILLFVFAFAVAVWALFQLASPTIFLATGSRTQTSRSLLEALVIVVLSGVVFSLHQRLAPPGLRLVRMMGRRELTAPMPPAPPAPPTPPLA